MPLLDRFRSFIESLPDAEFIDDLEFSEEQWKAPKADYFLANRRIVCEEKSLMRDTKQKIQPIFDEHMKKPGFPLVFGEVELQSVLSDVPEGPEINAEIVMAITSPIERLLKKSNKQISSTKRSFNLTNAGGMVTILNDAVRVIDPKLLAWRVCRELRKTKRDGEPRFDSIDCVFVLTETHHIPVNPNVNAPVSMVIPGLTSNGPRVAKYVDSFLKQWCKFEGAFLVDGSPDAFRSKSTTYL